MNEFTEFLHEKRIHAEAFRVKEEGVFEKWAAEFAQQSPRSFFEQKRFLINNLRHAYPYTPPAQEKSEKLVAPSVPAAKPSIPGASPKPVVPSAGPAKPKIPGVVPKPQSEAEFQDKPKEEVPKPALKPKIPGAALKPKITGKPKAD